MEITVFGETVPAGAPVGDPPEQPIAVADHGDGTVAVTIGSGADAGAYMF